MTPAAHYDKAVALMSRVDDMRDPCLPIARALTAQAAVHAALAQCDGGPTIHNTVSNARETVTATTANERL